MEEEDDWINNVRFGNGSHFYLDGYFNSKNCFFYGTGIQQEVLQQPLHSSKNTTLFPINSKTLIKFYCFEDGKERTVTINQENYCQVIHKFYASVSRQQGIVINEQWFMQDLATPHTAN